MQFVLVISSLIFAAGCLVSICAASNPQKWRKKIFEGWTGRRYGDDDEKLAPSRSVQQITAIFSALLLGGLSALLAVAALEYKDPETAAREKEVLERHFRESTEARQRESQEEFLKAVEEGFPVKDKGEPQKDEEDSGGRPASRPESK
ncbi:hypothetical protein [Haloferula rosea]|uniref:Transmembrane protein n=1 Tax=Haloferula rosea TaxID=490093 RepID=A0A934VFE4_9BACT|nr:hypothetical protein [Haloferula rosea]MBK1826475.1 hypothetical protein [Haloferula rosea]